MWPDGRVAPERIEPPDVRSRDGAPRVGEDLDELRPLPQRLRARVQVREQQMLEEISLADLVRRTGQSSSMSYQI